MRMVVAYQDEFCHTLGVLLSDTVVKPNATDLEMEHSWYEFGSLDNASTYQEALGAAVRADLIVLAIRADLDWPPVLGFWIEAWLAKRHGAPGALIALIAKSERHAQSAPLACRLWEVTDYFQEIAERGSLDYFQQEYFCESLMHWCSMANSACRARAITSVFEEIIQR